ncbi:hypothetical protein D3C72_374440 [compost metagenome]
MKKLTTTAAALAAITLTAVGAYHINTLNQELAAAEVREADLVAKVAKRDRAVDAMGEILNAVDTNGYQHGIKVAEMENYSERVISCYNKNRAVWDNCVATAFAGGDKETAALIDTTGYSGQVFYEQTFKTRESAVAALAKSGWTVDEAREKDKAGELTWDHDWPRTMKLVETKTGWAWVGSFVAIKPKGGDWDDLNKTRDERAKALMTKIEKAAGNEA